MLKTTDSELGGRPSGADNQWGILECDGGCSGNPGPMGAGAVLKSLDGQIIAKGYWPLGHGTNNIAEWLGLINGLHLAREHGVRKLLIYMDSMLVVKQVWGEYQVKKPHLKPLHKEAMDLLEDFAVYDIAHIRRKRNGQADALVKRAINRGNSEEE
jgi:ribonuclease HI